MFDLGYRMHETIKHRNRTSHIANQKSHIAHRKSNIAHRTSNMSTSHMSTNIKHQISEISNIQMVDLQSQYAKIKPEIDSVIQSVVNDATFINGPEVKTFTSNLEKYLNVKHVIPCGNGTDALQIAMMALELKKGDEVIIPAFTYAAVIEVIALLGLKPVLLDVNENDFNIDVTKIENAITDKTKVIVPVHLFGQACNMEEIMNIATKYNLFVIEDNAQAIGCDYTFNDGSIKKLGTIGHINTTSFFPTKNLGAYGDGGALMTNDDTLAFKARMICNHGQSKKYQHEIVGVNSRLDTIQAAILDVKLKYLDKWTILKNDIANLYNELLNEVQEIDLPCSNINSNHVFHQYTIKVKNNKRDKLKEHLMNLGIESMVYYPFPVHKQEAYRNLINNSRFSISEKLCDEVLSLPIHAQLSEIEIRTICMEIDKFFKSC